MQNRTRIAGFFAAVALMSSLAGAQALEPMAPKPPRSSASVVGRAVYIGTLQELNSFLFPSNVFDDQIIYQAIKWASGKAIGPYSVLVLDSQESLTGGLWAAWPNFMARHPDVVVTSDETNPIPYLTYETGLYDVLLIGNAWHGDPALVPPPNPGGRSWVFTDQEIADIEKYVREGHGLIATGGSFGQFARDTTLGYNNYKLASFMCLTSTGGGNPAHADAFPWSRNSSFYPPIRPPSPTTIFLYNDAPTHPIMLGIPASYAIAPNNAMAQWMSVVAGSGGTQLGHYGVGADQYQDSLLTACNVAP